MTPRALDERTSSIDGETERRKMRKIYIRLATPLFLSLSVSVSVSVSLSDQHTINPSPRVLSFGLIGIRGDDNADGK